MREWTYYILYPTPLQHPADYIRRIISSQAVEYTVVLARSCAAPPFMTFAIRSRYSYTANYSNTSLHCSIPADRVRRTRSSQGGESSNTTLHWSTPVIDVRQSSQAVDDGTVLVWNGSWSACFSQLWWPELFLFPFRVQERACHAHRLRCAFTSNFVVGCATPEVNRWSPELYGVAC